MFEIDRPRRRIFGLIPMTWLAIAVAMPATAAQEQGPQRFDLRIENGRVAGNLKTIRVRRNDAVEINWSADRRTMIHLHGYDIESVVEADKPQIMSFTARATGRFPIETHGARGSVILHLEVHPR